SIYTYLEQRFGATSEGVGALFFILSRLLGSALRMYLVVFVLYEFVFKAWGIPFWVPAVAFIALILFYTFRGGIKTIVWTDTLQTTFLLLAAILTLVFILKQMDMGYGALMRQAATDGLTKIWETDVSHPRFWAKQLLAGAFITITMTGLDQDMMQKNLTCRTLRDAQKNVLTSSLLFVVVNIIFLSLGAALICYAGHTGFALPMDDAGRVVGDKIFPIIAFSLNTFTAVVFVLGLVAAGYSSADGTLTALTTTFCFDFLHFDRRKGMTERQKTRSRKLIHVGFSVLYLLVIIAFRPFHSDSLINTLFDVASFTYGPLLGMYAFGLFTTWQVRDRWVPLVAIVSPVICYILKVNSFAWFSYNFGFELLLLNGMLTFIGLLLIGKKAPNPLKHAS
ncbi:MAG: sodium:solute symporter, partial [Bacteroidales bacterium]|nr:sodium:solute symporter [Bacteroidales bacterium]